MRKEQAIESLRTHMSVRFETSDDDPWLMGVLVRCADAPLRAASIEQLLLPWSPARPPERRTAWGWPPPQRQATAGAGRRPSCSA